MFINPEKKYFMFLDHHKNMKIVKNLCRKKCLCSKNYNTIKLELPDDMALFSFLPRVYIICCDHICNVSKEIPKTPHIRSIELCLEAINLPQNCTLSKFKTTRKSKSFCIPKMIESIRIYTGKRKFNY